MNFNDLNQRFAEWSLQTPRCLPRLFWGESLQRQSYFYNNGKMLLLGVFAGLSICINGTKPMLGKLGALAEIKVTAQAVVLFFTFLDLQEKNTCFT